MLDRLAIHLQDSFSTGKGVRSAADHDAEHPIFGPGLATGNRCIQKTGVPLPTGGIQPAGDLGRGGGVIDQYRARCQRLYDAVRAQRNLMQILIITDTGHDELGTLSRRCRGLSQPLTMLANPSLRLAQGAIVDTDFMSGANQMCGHGIPHGS